MTNLEGKVSSDPGMGQSFERLKLAASRPDMEAEPVAPPKSEEDQEEE